MGLGKYKDDGTGPILGTLHKMPWEREPLTEIQLLREDAVTSDLDDRGPVKRVRDLSAK